MRKYMCVHTIGPNAMTREQVQQVAQAAQMDQEIKGYRSFLNLTEGKVLCIMEANSKDTLSRWFKKMNIPFDSITAVEIEGERGTITDLLQETEAATQIHA